MSKTTKWTTEHQELVLQSVLDHGNPALTAAIAGATTQY